jgi:hypothetical protein
MPCVTLGPARDERDAGITEMALATARSDEIEYRLASVMPALVAGIHVFLRAFQLKHVDSRDKPGHDSE